MLPCFRVFKTAHPCICTCFFIFFSFHAHSQCSSYIGEIAAPDTSSIYLCKGDSIAFQMDSISLMDNQDLFYVFHQYKNLTPNDTIIEINQTGLYENRETSVGEIFITAIIAEESDSTVINFDDPCLVLSNTVSMVNLSDIEIETKVNCRSKKFSFSISGGFPEFNEDSFYITTGSHLNFNVKANEIITIEREYDSFIPGYSITAFDAVGCSMNYSSLPISCNHLAVHLFSIEGEQTEAGNLLKWTYVHESYLDFFLIEFSKNRVEWMLLDTIKAEGIPSEPSKYEFLDSLHWDETRYYRLSSVDVDEVVIIEGMIKMYFPGNYFEVYPTITKNILKVAYESTDAAPFNLMIFDMQGRKILLHSEEKSLFRSYKEIDISHLPNNIYFLVISSNDFTESKKFVVQR